MPFFYPANEVKMYSLLYGIIILVATFLGTFVGLGGGVIIKPMLDLIGHDTIDAVNFISSCAVFSMSISSTIRHIKSKTKINFGLIANISVGAIIGGICGSRAFDLLLQKINNTTLKNIQGIMLGILLVMAVIYVNTKNAKSFNVKNPAGVAIVGLLMGFIASFLGIGGGPINVAFLILFFSMPIKEASVYSIGTIFFSQLSKLITTAVTHTVPQVSPVTMLTAICCAILGGILGATANKRGNDKAIRIVFTIFVSAVAFVNFYNGFK